MSPERHRLMYADEKFRQAIYELAVGRERIKDRLHDAMMFVIRLAPEDLPGPLDNRLRDLLQRMNRVQPKQDEGTLQATLNVIDEDEAAEAAREIYELGSEVEDAYRDAKS